ncbi:MAG: hypothetical protein AMXMBFR84_29810 [Candidatus Hydrogenedentota bacterium]
MLNLHNATHLASVALILLLSSCGGGGAPEARAPIEPPESVSVFYTCDTRGNLDACNCPQGVAGGLARRSTYLESNRKGPSILVDAGNVTHGSLPFEVFEMEFLLKGYTAMNYDAVNLGERELSLGAARIKALSDQFPLLVSANVRDASGMPIVPNHRIVTLADGYRIGIMGVVKSNVPSDLIAQDLKVLPEEEAIAQALPELQAQSDLIVLLAYVDLQRMKALAERFFEIGIIVGGDVQQPSAEAEIANRSLLVYTTDKGKTIGSLNVGFAGGQPVPMANEITMLLEDQPGTKAVAALLNEFRIERTNRNYPVREETEAEHTALTPSAGG